MSASTRFTQLQPDARSSNSGSARYRFAVIGFGAVALAMIGGVGIALVSHAPEVPYQSAASQEEPISAAQSTPHVGLSPSREAWYVEDRSASVPAVPSVPSARLMPWRDAWYLEEDRSASASAPGTPHVAEPGNMVADRWFDEPWARRPAAEPTAKSILREPLRDRWYLEPNPNSPNAVPQPGIDNNR
jgi:hypothetical protein